ncbi:hypothetical protein Tco_1526200, partial [Tanacetum coccineum]
MSLPPRYQSYQYLRYEGLQYTDADIADFEIRLARIYRREVHRVYVFNFGGLLDLIAEGLSTRMLMEHKDAQGQSVFTSQAWRRLFDIRVPLVHELILEFFSTFSFGEAVLDLDKPGALQFQLGGVQRRMDVGSVNVPYLLARYLRLFALGRKQGAMISGDMAKLPGGGDEDKEMPQAVPPPPRTQGARISRLEGEVHGMREALQGQREVLDSMARDFSSFTTWTITSLARLMDMVGVPYTRYSESPVEYQRCTRQRQT